MKSMNYNELIFNMRKNIINDIRATIQEKEITDFEDFSFINGTCTTQCVDELSEKIRQIEIVNIHAKENFLLFADEDDNEYLEDEITLNGLINILDWVNQ